MALISTLVVLVGMSPLPNYVVARKYNPKRLILIYSEQTSLVCRILERVLKRDMPSCEFHSIHLNNPESASAVRNACRQAFANVADGIQLDYTGGKKTMAAAARMTFESMGGTDAQASYVDDDNNQIVLDTGYAETIALDIPLDTLCELHNVTLKRKYFFGNGPTAEDANRITGRVLENPDLAGKLYCSFKQMREKKRPPNDAAAAFAKELGFDPQAWSGEAQCKRWGAFLTGEWLEVWMASLVAPIGEPLGFQEVSVGNEAILRPLKTVEYRTAEVDVCAMRGHRLHLISCTTNTSKVGECKQKAFEAAFRARQMGGALARVAVVSLIHGVNDAHQRMIDLVRADVSGLWTGAVRPQVFGLEDVRAWHAGEIETLANWLSR